MKRLCKIYTLSHPLTNEVRYIGKTVESLSKRLGKHIVDSRKRNHRCANWIKSITKLNLKPIIEEVDQVPENICSETEIYWIAQFKAWDFRLINHTIGGEGTTGYKYTEAQKLNLSIKLKGNTNRLGIPHTNETKLLISSICKGVKHSEEERKAKSIRMLNHYVSKETKNKISEKRKGKLSNKARSIINVKTSEIWNSIESAAISNNLEKTKLWRMLKKDNTDFKYLEKS
jgi:hypothetical protein